MAKVVTSGLHKLKDTFGELTCDSSQEIQRLQSQLNILDQTIQAAELTRRGREPIAWLMAIVGTVIGLIFVGSAQLAYSDSEQRLLTGLMAVVSAAALASVVWSYFRFIVQVDKDRSEYKHVRADVKGKLRTTIDSYANSILQRLDYASKKRGEMGRTVYYSDNVWLYCCPSFVCMIDIGIEEMLLVNMIDCRDVQLSTRVIERRSHVVGCIESGSKRAIAGAAVGGLIFGSDGVVVGSIVGSASERNVSMRTVETDTVLYAVDIYTRIPSMPVVTLDFGEDDRRAKEFYGFIAAAVPH